MHFVTTGGAPLQGPVEFDGYIHGFCLTLRSPNTRRTYAESLLHLARRAERRGIAHPRLIGEAFIQAWFDDILVNNAHQTAVSRLAAVRSFYRWLKAKGEVKSNPTAEIVIPKTRPGRRSVAAADEIAEALHALPYDTIAELRDRAMISLALNALARVEQITAMDVGDLLFGVNPVVYLSSASGVKQPTPARAMLISHLQSYVEAAAIADDPAGPLFRRARQWVRFSQQRMTPGGVAAAIRLRLRSVGLERVGARVLRGTAIASLLDSGAPLEATQAMARHASVATTRRYGARYGELTADLLDEHLPF